MKGTVYLVGAGPGAPDLLTLRAVRVLQDADILFHDALVHTDVVALAARARKIAVGKRCGRHSTAQKFINKRLVDAASRYATVVRLKGGDPMLFGRAQEEIAALEVAGVRCEVVPGVTAALAASAELRVALTQRGFARSVAFVTPRVGIGERTNEWVRAIMSADSGVIYMGVGEAHSIAQALITAGKPPSTPVAIVENASSPHARHIFTTLGALPELANVSMNGPAIILLGEQFRALADARPASASDAPTLQSAAG